MTVDDAFGIACGARCITHSGSSILVEGRPIDSTRLAADKRFIVKRRLQFTGRFRRVAHNDVQFDALQLIGEVLQERHEIAIYEDDGVLGIVDDVRQLIGKQAQIQRVQHRAEAGYGEIQLQVTVGIPREGGDAVPLLHACRAKCVGKLRRALSPLAKGIAMQAFICLGDDFLFAKKTHSAIVGVL